MHIQGCGNTEIWKKLLVCTKSYLSCLFLNIRYLQTQLLVQIVRVDFSYSIAYWSVAEESVHNWNKSNLLYGLLYEDVKLTHRNRLTTWTENSVGAFFSYSVPFSARALHLLTFSCNSLLPEPYSLLLLLLNICPLSRLKPNLHV